MATEPDEREEIEVTPEMIRAGVAVFRERDAFDMFGDLTLERLVGLSYLAMDNARISGRLATSPSARRRSETNGWADTLGGHLHRLSRRDR